MTTTGADRNVGAQPLRHVRAGWREGVESECVKYRSVRATVALTVALALVLPTFAAIVAATESLQPDDTILGASLLGGAALAQILAASLGASLITAECRTGMIRTTLAACPRRLTVLAAKSTVAAVVALAVTLPSGAAAHGLGLLLLDADVYATGEPFPALLGVALAVASMAVLGVGIGTIVRHPAGAVGAVVAVVLLPGLLAPLLGDVQRWIGGASLGGVMQKLTQSSDATPESVGSLGAWPSLAIVLAYTAATVLAAGWVLRRRDT
jgi:ABC-type transport system involved in multi-copper enzyme maturation permease subunit